MNSTPLIMIPQWLTDFDTLDSFWIRLTKLCWISVSVPRVTSVQWMLKLYSVVMAGLGIILSLSWTCFHVYVLSVTQLPELRQQRWRESCKYWHDLAHTREDNENRKMTVIPGWLWLWRREPNQTLSHKFPAVLACRPRAYIDYHQHDGDYLNPFFFSFQFNLIPENNL